jgi:hypothetical protein
MELTRLETKTGASKGAFLHLKHPALGHLMYTGPDADSDGRRDGKNVEKVGCHVLGLESERVRERAKAIQGKKLKGDDDAEEAGIAFVSSLVVSFKGLTKDGKPLEATDESKREFFAQSDSLVEQVMEFAQDRANFFGVSATA